jgi:type IV pilus assembly protein PilQ
MMTQATNSRCGKTAARKGACAFAFAALISLTPALSQAKATGSVVVERITTTGTGSAREIVIATSKEATFSVFRLSDPFRILVDINDGKSGLSTEMTKVADGLVRYVATNQFADESSAILRVEIALDRPAEYHVRADGQQIRVTVGAEAPAPTPEPASQVEPAPAPEAAVLPIDTAPAVEPAAPAAPLEPVRLGKLSRTAKGKKAVLSAPILTGALTPQAVRLEQLEGPRRLVVDLGAVSAEPKFQKLSVGKLGVKTARLATHENGVRVVLDLDAKAEVPQVDVEEAAGQLRLVISKAVAQAAPQQVAASPTEAPTPAPIAVVTEAPAPAPLKANAAKVVDVRFEPKDGFMRLVMVLDSETIDAKNEDGSEANLPVLRLSNTTLPSSLERTLDVSEVAAQVVGAISTYSDGGDTIIAANVAQGTEHRHWKKGNRLMWDFRNTRAKPQAYQEQATAGFTAATTAVQTAATLAPSKKAYTGRRINLDLKDAEIDNVLRLLADVSKLNIVAADDVKGKITIKLTNVPWDQALDIILRAKQLDKTRNGNIIRVAPIEVLRKEEELRIERAKSRIELEPLSVRLVPVSYAVAGEIKPQVSALLSPRGKVNIDIRTNVLVVEDIAEVLLKIERLVRTLDTQTPQVLIEARIVEARSNFSRDLGVQWGGNVSATQQFGTATGLGFPNNIRIAGGADDQQNNQIQGVVANPNYAVNLPASVGSGTGGALGFVFGSVGGSALISLRLSAAESIGKVKIISAPKVVTLDNKEAKIVSGEQVPITVITANGPSTRFIPANLELVVTPHVTQDGSILMKVSAKKNEISDRRDNLGVPGIITKEAETEMIVKDGDTAVLGGIYKRQAQENKAYVPWIGEVPVLGWLFKQTTRTDARDELLIFISPRIVNRSAALVQST